MTWEDIIKKAAEYKSMISLLREARDAGREAEEGLNYQWKILNSGEKIADNDSISMNEIERRIKVIDNAIIDIGKIIGDLEKAGLIL
tara:strand:+ start:82 stop:342 length:261 start_codon:yes stop_codon:yes gene_type:complete